MNKKHFYQYQFSHLKDNLVNMALAIAAIIVSILMLEIGLRTYVAIQLYKDGHINLHMNSRTFATSILLQKSKATALAPLTLNLDGFQGRGSRAI